MAAVVILKSLSDAEITAPDTTPEVLRILRQAFGCPSRCVVNIKDRQPQVTMLLLEHLHNTSDVKLRSEIAETKKFIMGQTAALQ